MPDICTVPLPKFIGGICGRPLTDPCAFCRAFDENKEEWAAVFNEYRDKPRIAVEGDL